MGIDPLFATKTPVSALRALHADMDARNSCASQSVGSPGSITEELGLAQKLAVEMRRNSDSRPGSVDVPSLEELVDAMEMRIAHQIDDYAIRIQSLSRHSIYALNAVNSMTQKKLNIFMVICAAQLIISIAFLIFN